MHGLLPPGHRAALEAEGSRDGFVARVLAGPSHVVASDAALGPQPEAGCPVHPILVYGAPSTSGTFLQLDEGAAVVRADGAPDRTARDPAELDQGSHLHVCGE